MTVADFQRAMMTDEEFGDFLARSRSELAVRQDGFQRRIEGYKKWFYDLESCVLTLDGTSFSITPIGTFSPKYQSWLWAWANDEFPALAREKSKRIQGLHEVTGFQVFVVPGLNATPNDSDDFVALSLLQLKAIGFFRSPSTNEEVPSLFLAIDG